MHRAYHDDAWGRTFAPHEHTRAVVFEDAGLLGKSQTTMVWLAFDPRVAQELMLTLPRAQPATSAALERWLDDVRLAARLDHPNLAHVVDVGVQEHWPYVAVDRALGLTLPEWLAAHPHPAPLDAFQLARRIEGELRKASGPSDVVALASRFPRFVAYRNVSATRFWRP